MSPTATPIGAVDAASWRSATRISGRRRSRAAGSPTAVISGSGGNSVAESVRPAARSGSRPVSTLEAVMERGIGGLQGIDGRQGRAQLRSGARGIQLGAAAGVQPRVGESNVCLLVLDVATRHRQLILCAAQLEVGARDFRDDRDLGIMEARFGPLEVGVAGFALPRRTRPNRSSSQVASKPAS